MAKLTAAARKRVPASETGLPGKRTSKGGAVSGSYPMPDKAHARNAKARAAQFASPAEKAEIDAKADRILGKSGGGKSSTGKRAGARSGGSRAARKG